MGYFAHSRLDAYRAAIEFLALAQPILKRLDNARGELGDQLNRAAISIVLNLAEGAAEARPAEKRRFFRMALRSAAECAASLDIIVRLDPDSTKSVTEAATLLERVGAMLARLANRRAISTDTRREAP